MYRFNVSSPERRTHDIFSKEYPKPNLPRFHTLQFKISCTLKITCQRIPYLIKPPSCRSNEQRRPDSCKTHHKEETSHQSPMGTAQKATVVLATEKRFILPARAFREPRCQEWNGIGNYLLFPDHFSVYELCHLTVHIHEC